MKYKNIIWDWNGTLLNDLQTGVNTLNDMLERRGIPLLSSNDYKELFRFPVIDFYEEIGFDFHEESMHEVSLDFVETYERFSDCVTLTDHVSEVLPHLKKKGVHNYVLSALNQHDLDEMTLRFGIAPCFDYLCGSNDIYGSSKIERGIKMIESLGLNKKETVMVGDTTHDAEVAEAMGVPCLLYAGGHNSLPRLKAKAPVFTDFLEIEKWIDE